MDDPALLRALQRRRIGLVTSVRPGDLGEVALLLRSCRNYDVDVCLWPMLHDDDGRWLSAANARVFASFHRELMTALSPSTPPAHALVFDLEPPIDDLRALLRGRWMGRRRPARDVRATVANLIVRTRARHLEPWATIVPPILYDAPHRLGWQRLLGTPVDPLPFARVSPMLYTSLLEGYSRGFIRRSDALAYLAHAASRCLERFGERASVSLGAVGVGAMGDERVYVSPLEVAADVDVVLATGIEHIALFDLGGMLARPPLEAWLDALTRDRPSSPPPVIRSWRSTGVAWLGHAISHVAHALQGPRRPRSGTGRKSSTIGA